MATLADRQYSEDLVYVASTARDSHDRRGLAQNLAFAVGILALGSLAFETLRRKRRRTRAVLRGQKRSEDAREDLTMGYIYEARSWLDVTPSDRVSRVPFGWLWKAAWTSERWYLTHCGLDAAVYVRWLTACLYFTTLQLLTTFPILLAVHLHYAPNDPSISQIGRASITSLVVNDKNLLGIHAGLMWWTAITFFGMLYWCGKGAVALRRSHLHSLLQRAVETEADRSDGRDSDAGWRYRTIVLRNIPLSANLRDEQRIVEYFERRLSENRAVSPALSRKSGEPSQLVSRVVVVRRNLDLQGHIAKRNAALEALESSHVKLARSVLGAIRRHRSGKKVKVALSKDQLDQLATALGDYADSASASYPERTIWEVMRTLDKQLLDPFQPVIKLRLFHGQKVPAIDYHVARVNLLTSLIDEARGHAEDAPATSTAFVTFAKASDARRAAALQAHRYVCSVRPAPDTRDIIWNQLARVSFTSDSLRAILLEIGITFLTIVWILPISLLLGLVSLDNIAHLVGPLADWLNDHARAKSLLSYLLPTLLVSLIGLLIPVILFLIVTKAQRIYLNSKIHEVIIMRYWIWLVINVVVFFCVGTALIKLFFQDPLAAIGANSLLERIAAAFPAGAIFYVSWTLIQIAIHISFELSSFLWTWILHVTKVRVALSPRRRREVLIPRNINFFYWLPQHLLLVGIGLVFQLLNPVVAAFVWLYFLLILALFKHQFAHVFIRVRWELNGRMFLRCLRLTIDMLLLSEVVIMAFMFINSEPGPAGAVIALIVVTAISKLVATRWWSAHMDALDIVEADIVCRNELPNQDEKVLVSLVPGIFRSIRLFKSWHIALPVLRLGHTGDLEAARKSMEMLKRTSQVERAQRTSQGEDSPMMRRTASDDSTAAADSPTDGERSAENEKAVTKEIDMRTDTTVPLVEVENAQLVSARPPSPPRSDWPDPSQRYDDPAQVQPIDRFLWLPRDPLLDIDLRDTIEWRGECLTSTEGGEGRLGAWQLVDEPDEMLLEKPPLEHRAASMPTPDTADLLATPEPRPRAATIQLPESRSPTRDAMFSRYQRLQGSERLRLAKQLRSPNQSSVHHAWRSLSGSSPPREGMPLTESPDQASERPDIVVSPSLPDRRVASAGTVSLSPQFSPAFGRPSFFRRPSALSEEGGGGPSGALPRPRRQVSQSAGIQAAILAEEAEAVLKREEEMKTVQKNEAEAQKRVEEDEKSGGRRSWRSIFRRRPHALDDN